MSKGSTSNPGAATKKAGPQGESDKVADVNSLILKDILVELKINNQILNEVHDLDVNERDIK